MILAIYRIIMSNKGENMIKLSKIDNTVFFNSSRHNCPMAFLVVSFRKNEKTSTLSQIRKQWKEAKAREEKDLTVSLNALESAKQSVYLKRCDLERDIKTVISPILSSSDIVKPSEAVDLLLNGKGYSAISGKKLRPITCQEKRRKILIELINLL